LRFCIFHSVYEYFINLHKRPRSPHSWHCLGYPIIEITQFKPSACIGICPLLHPVRCPEQAARGDLTPHVTHHQTFAVTHQHILFRRTKCALVSEVWIVCAWNYCRYHYPWGHAVAQWLRRYVTNRKVEGSIPDEVSDFYQFT
jgi:hypothetical protein